MIKNLIRGVMGIISIIYRDKKDMNGLECQNSKSCKKARFVLRSIIIIILGFFTIFLVSCSRNNEKQLTINNVKEQIPTTPLFLTITPNPKPTISDIPISVTLPLFLPTDYPTREMEADIIKTRSPKNNIPPITPTLQNTLEQTQQFFNESNPIYVAILFAEERIIVLADKAGKPVKIIKLEKYIPIDVKWSEDKCFLYVTVITEEATSLLEIDLDGNIKKELFVGGQNSSGDWLTTPVLSPNERWISYAVWSGEENYIGSEFQDIEILNVLTNQSIRITKHGGSGFFGAAWSPDGAKIAYSDFDDNGIYQFYHSDVETRERFQLSHFTEKNFKIGTIKWSPNGKMIAFMTYGETDTITLWTISLESEELRQKTFKGIGLIQEELLWWFDDSSKILVKIRDGDLTTNGLYWVNVEDFQIQRVYLESDAPYKEITHPSPTDDNKVMFYGGNGGFYLFNMENESIELWQNWENFSSDISKWSLLQQISPVMGEIDINSCRK